MSTFVNFSNHPSDKWDKAQTVEAEKYGRILDIPFPDVHPEYTEEDIKKLANECVARILTCNPSAVLCQGEFTLCFEVVSRLKDRGVIALAACSKRDVMETSEGKLARFKFVKFREY